jgi:hypothetical protein
MSHRHEWDYEEGWDWGGGHFECTHRGCREKLFPSTDEVLNRLNATEYLSADEAESIAHGLPDEYSMLNDYARTLEGKDD